MKKIDASKASDVKTVNAADLAKALHVKSDVRAGAVVCRTCGLGGGVVGVRGPTG